MADPRRRLLPPLLAAFALIHAACGPFPVEEKPRHLVMVVFDTLRADRMSLYGYPLETTPFLDGIAGELLRFEEVKAPAPWTVPGHSTLFTGLWPSLHRAQWGSMYLRDEFLTLAEIVGEEGFCTVGLSANLLVSKSTGLDQGFESFELIRGPWKEKSAEILSRLPARLDEVERRGCRLFLFLNFMDTHIPYSAQRHGSAFGADGPGPVRNAKIKWEVSAGVRTLDEDELRRHAAAYDAAVRYVDDVTAELLSILSERGLLDESLFLLTSDHGDGLGAHPELGHSISVWEEQLAVPLVVRFPRGRKTGVLSGTTSLVGVVPSVLDWLGLPRPEHLSLAADLETAADRPVVADYRSYFSESNRQTNARMAERYPELAARVAHSHVLYCGRHKLVARDAGTGDVRAEAELHFYDLASDPDEQTDLAATRDPAFETCARNYRSLVGQGWLTPFGALPETPDGEERPLDLEALRSLGYVQ